MEQKRTLLQKLVRGSIIIISSIIASVLIYFGTSAWIFEIPIWNISELLEHGYIVFTNIGNPYLKLKAYYPIAYASIPYICCIVYWLLDNNTIKNSYGNARFATTKDFKEMGLNLESKGVQFACMIKGKKRIPISTQKPLAILIVAPAGTGKTASVALPNLFSLPNSVFVLDIKGELLEKSAGYRQKNFKNEILVFSPLDKRNSMYFNPFDNTIIKDFDFVEMMQLADQIAGTIFVGEKGKENDHWIVSAKTLFTFFALYNMQKYKNATLGELSQAPKKDYYNELTGIFKEKVSKPIFKDSLTGEIIGSTEEDKREYIDSQNFPEDFDNNRIISDWEKDPDQIGEIWKTWLMQVSEDTTLDDFVRNQARAYQSAAETEFASIKSTYDTFMKVFANPKVAEATSKMSFDYEDLREKKISVYVVIQTQDMDILAPLVRILVESMFKKLMFNENSDPNKFIYFILDEFIRFGKMSFLLEAPALCRSYGLVPLYITQSYEQIKKYYGDDDLKILRANAAFQVVFRMNSYDDAKTLSDMVGDYTRKKLSTSKDSMAVLKKNNSISEEGYKLITPQDILSSPDGQVFVLVGGFLNRPVKTQANLWFKNPALKGADKIPYDKDNKEIYALREAESKNTESSETKQNTKSSENNTEKLSESSESTKTDSNKTTESSDKQTTESSNKETNDAKDSKDTKETNESKDSKASQDSKGNKDSKDSNTDTKGQKAYNPFKYIESKKAS